MADEIKNIPVPAKLNERQAKLANAWVKERHELGITVAEFTKKHGISSKTWYEWLKDATFEKYLNDLQGVIITDDDREAFYLVKKKVTALATGNNAGVKEISLFLDLFGYVAEDEKRKSMQKLGINPTAPAGQQEKTLEEKKASLLARLKGNDINGKKY